MVMTMRILLTNDDGWDAPGLAALKTLAAELGEVLVLAPRDPQSYRSHRVTTDRAMHLVETAPSQFHLAGTPADCVRAALREVISEVDWVLSGINRGGNLGADLFTSGTVAAAREAALLGRPAIAISQYVRRNSTLDWSESIQLARPVLSELIRQGCRVKGYWNVNLPHLEAGSPAPIIYCDPDHEPLDVKFRREGDHLHYAGSYQGRPQTPGRDVALCFGGAVTVSRLQL